MDGSEMEVRRVDDELAVIVELEAGYCFGELGAVGGLMGRAWVQRVKMGGWRDTLVELVVATSANKSGCECEWNHVRSRHRR